MYVYRYNVKIFQKLIPCFRGEQTKSLHPSRNRYIPGAHLHTTSQKTAHKQKHHKQTTPKQTPCINRLHTFT